MESALPLEPSRRRNAIRRVGSTPGEAYSTSLFFVFAFYPFHSTMLEFFNFTVEFLFFFVAFVFFARDAVGVVARILAASPATCYAPDKDQRQRECR
jgi:hypothetical protein